MAQRDAADLDSRRARWPPETRAILRIVVAGDPDPLAILLHDAQDLQVLDAMRPRGADVVQAVAERDDACWAR